MFNLAVPVSCVCVWGDQLWRVVSQVSKVTMLHLINVDGGPLSHKALFWHCLGKKDESCMIFKALVVLWTSKQQTPDEADCENTLRSDLSCQEDRHTGRNDPFLQVAGWGQLSLHLDEITQDEGQWKNYGKLKCKLRPGSGRLIWQEFWGVLWDPEVSYKHVGEPLGEGQHRVPILNGWIYLLHILGFL